VYNYGTSEVTIISEGTFSSISGPTLSRTVRVLLEEHKLFNYAILTAENISIGGNASIDSYDSSLGPYGGANINQNGDIVTNSDDDSAITIYGSADVNGDAITGPDGTVSVGGSATLSGSTDDTAEVLMPSVTVPDSLKNLGSQGDISIDQEEDSLVLSVGDYKYDSLDLSGKGTLTLGNPGESGEINIYFTQDPSITTSGQSEIIVSDNIKVNIYFEGNVSISGQGVTNENGDPSDLVFYGTDNVANISLSGIGTFYGAFYAPDADYFDISGNSAIYGAVVGKNVTVTGSAAIHYDEQLQNDSPTKGYDPYAWQEK
jgi:hypothetical protein